MMAAASRRFAFAIACAVVWIVTCCSAFGRVVLFDGALQSSPQGQGWPFIADPLFGHTVTQTVRTGYTELNTLQPMSDRGGYFSRDPLFGVLVHPNMPPLNGILGYEIEFHLRIGAEVHVTGPGGDDNGDGLDDRAGFSVIALWHDRYGVELSYWPNRIWAQDDDAVAPSLLFTQAEGAAWDTSLAIRPYKLRVHHARYQLVRGDGVVPLLSGRSRNYQAFSGSVDPYEIPNFLFLGDNTTRGESLSEIAFIAAGDLPPPCVDADALVDEIVSGNDNPAFDLNFDGQVDGIDLDTWRVTAGELWLGGGLAFQIGDANLNGTVDGADFAVWNSRKFTPGDGWCGGDFNADGWVDGSDFSLWNAHRAVSAVAAVPEPTGPGILFGLWAWRQTLKRHCRWTCYLRRLGLR